MSAIESLELYDKFLYTYYTIGSTKYRQIDYSPMLSTVYVKTKYDRRYRSIQDFFGETAKSDAQRYCLDLVNN